MGTKSKKKAKTRLDAYYRMAKDQGFRSRAAYKLIQLNKKYDFLARSKVVVDLCAAPGGWCQVAAQYMPVGSKIVGVDLVPIAPIRGVKTFVGDITDDKTRKTIKTWLKKEPVDCVIHDGAPNVGGVWAKDLFAQNALVLCAAKMACDLLKPGGWFVTKVFRSPDYQKLLWVMKQLFEKVEATKPLASRMESAEIFVTCAGYKAPKNLDARLFQTQYVFADVGEEKIMTPSGLLVMPRTNVPQGYDEFSTVLSRTATLSQYLDCEDPKEFLKKYHEIRFETDEERALHRSRWSKPELVILCQDLQQVSDGDKRRLLRWREQLQRERATRRLNESLTAPAAASADGAAKAKKPSADGSDDEGSDGEYSDVASDGGAVLDEDAAVGDDLDTMTKQLLEIRRAREKEQKRKQKKMVDRKLKKVRGLINYDPTESAHSPTEMAEGVSKRLGDDEVDDSTDDGSDGELEGNDADWSIADLANVPEKQVAKLFDKNFQEDDNNGLNVPLNAITDVLINPDDEMEVGSQDEFDVHDKLLEEGGEDGELDVDFHGNFIPNAKVAERVSFFDTPGVGSDEDEDEDAAPAAKQKQLTAEEKKQKRLDKNAEKLDEVGKQSKWQRRHLNVEQVLRETFPKASAAGKAGKRRGRTEEDLVEMGDGAASGAAKGASSRALTREALRQGRLHDESDGSSDDQDDDISSLEAALAESDDERGGSDDDGAKIVAGRGKQRGKMQVMVPDAAKLTAMEQVKAQRKQLKKDNKKNKAAAKKNKKDDTAFEEIPLAMTDPDVRARTLALATKMLDKRARKEILDGSVNRFMHNDDEDMPDWFIKDEQRNNKIYMPVTAAEIDAQRRRFQEMNLRPGKKVMEAMGRKRRKAQRMLRGLLDKGKTDPSVRNKVQGLSVRKLMRSKAVKGPGIQKKKEPLDNKRRGEKRREKQKAKRAGKGGR
jgi:AdoMet-dependent rRNA methyltransferase SPB1